MVYRTFVAQWSRPIFLVPWNRYEGGGRTDPLAPKASSTLATMGSGVDGAVTGTVECTTSR